MSALDDSEARGTTLLEALQRRYPIAVPPNTVTQEGDAAMAFERAKLYKDDFERQVRDLAERESVKWGCRPGSGVKSAERILEKAVNGIVPLDMLGGKFVVTSLEDAYRIGQCVSAGFQVRGFKDRFAKPQRSGYRDLQFTIELNGEHGVHLAEVKVVLEAFDELDETEHRIYEIVRSLEHRLKQGKISPSEQDVMQRLLDLSRALYTERWEAVLREAGV
jgi:hypothetical protein